MLRIQQLTLEPFVHLVMIISIMTSIQVIPMSLQLCHVNGILEIYEAMQQTPLQRVGSVLGD